MICCSVWPVTTTNSIQLLPWKSCTRFRSRKGHWPDFFGQCWPQPATGLQTCSLGSMNWGSSLARITVPGGCTSVPSGCTNLSQSKSVQLAMDGLMEQQLRPFNFESTTGEKRTRNSKMMDRTHSSQDRGTKLLWKKKSSIAVFHGPIHSATKATGLSIAVLRRKD